jgi:hypoxanthine phosphoribosyltransferase
MGFMQSYRLVPRISAEEISAKLDQVAAQINFDYKGQSLVVIGILKGSFIFLADLIRKLSLPVELDFVRLVSYGCTSETCGSVQITKDIELSIQGRHVLVVEDIVDSGITLEWFRHHLSRFEPASVKLCALINKTERRKCEVRLDYSCIHIEAGFLVGYGLDYSERHRNLPGIYEVEFD